MYWYVKATGVESLNLNPPFSSEPKFTYCHEEDRWLQEAPLIPFLPFPPIRSFTKDYSIASVGTRFGVYMNNFPVLTTLLSGVSRAKLFRPMQILGNLVVLLQYGAISRSKSVILFQDRRLNDIQDGKRI